MNKLLVIFIIVIVQCNSQNGKNVKSEIDTCEKYKVKTGKLIENFYLNGDTTSLDSAIYYIDIAIERCPEKKFFNLRKLSILSLKQEFSKAINLINNLEDTLFTDMPYYNDVLLMRFKAMKAQSEGNMQERDMYINRIIKRINMFLYENEQKVDFLLRSSNTSEILENPLATALTQSYYYKSLVKGKNVIKSELKEKQKSNDLNEDFIIYLTTVLDEDFMIFIGF